MNDLMVRFNVQLRSVTEPIDTAMGRTLFAVLSGRAEQELKNIVDRTANGRAKACEDGFAGGAVPYGYEPDGDGGLRAVPHEALIIRRMSERCAGPAAGAPTPAESWPASVAARQTHPSADPLHLAQGTAAFRRWRNAQPACPGRAAGRPRRGPLAPRSDAGRARPRPSARYTSRKATSLRFAKNPGIPPLLAPNISKSYFALPRI